MQIHLAGNMRLFLIRTLQVSLHIKYNRGVSKLIYENVRNKVKVTWMVIVVTYWLWQSGYCKFSHVLEYMWKLGVVTKICFLMLYNSISWSKPLAFQIWIISVLRMTWLEPSPTLRPKLCVDKENKIQPLFVKLCFFLSLLCAFRLIDCPSSVHLPDSNIYCLVGVLYHETLGA